MSLKQLIETDMKDALRAGDKLRLSVLRMLVAGIKQREIDDRRELDEPDVLQIIEKQVKQRREAATQFGEAGRSELEQKELQEAEILKNYLPEPLSEADVETLVDEVIAATGASTMKDMGKVMSQVRDKAQGRADMSVLSALVKARLSA